jgi:hypothetical protein
MRTVRTSPAAVSSPALREAVAAHAAALSLEQPDPAPIPAAIEPYVRKVTCHAYKVLDREVDALRAAGYGVDEVFEITVSAAVGAAFARMEAALAALEEGR